MAAAAAAVVVEGWDMKCDKGWWGVGGGGGEGRML